MIIHTGDKFRTINRLLRTRRVLPLFLAANLLLLGVALCGSPTAAARLSVEVEPVTREESYEVERVYAGEVRAGRSSTLGFRHSGEIRTVHVQEGDAVAAGALLAELDPEPLEAQLDQAEAQVRLAEASVDAAAATVELAEATAGRHRELTAKGHVSEQRNDEVRLDLRARRAELALARAEVVRALAAARAARVDLDRSRIHAPYDAHIQTRHADEGSMVVPGQAVLRIVEHGRREARIGLPPDVAAGMRSGTRHDFRHGSHVVAGTLLHLLPEVDGRTRTRTALFALDPVDPPPAAGSIIELTLARSIAEPGFWLPLAALSEAQRGLWSVFVVTADERIERRLVEVLHSERDRVFVRGTLADGDRVVTTGTQRVVPGQAVAAHTRSEPSR